MSRKLRIEYPGAMYRAMNRGDQREDILGDDDDRQRFLSTVGEACGKTEWQVPAYCLMRNHFPRQETTLSLKWIAQRLDMGSWTCVSTNRVSQCRESASPRIGRLWPGVAALVAVPLGALDSRQLDFSLQLWRSWDRPAAATALRRLSLSQSRE